MNVLVSGGAGYIGRVTCKFLSDNGFRPVTIDNLVNGDRDAVRWGPFYQGNIKDIELVQHILQKEDIKAVVHLAADINVGESMENPLRYYENNLTASVEFIGEVVKNGIENFVFSSTCAVYGQPTSLPVREDHDCKPMSVYGSTKLSVENLLRNLTLSYPLKSLSLRYFNVAGSHQDLGETRHPPIHLIPCALRSLRNPQIKLQVFGNSYATPDGSCIRDYVHVEDIASANILALKKILSLREPKYNNTYNLGSGRGYSVFEILRTIENISQQTLNYEILPVRKGDPANLFADIEKARRELDWQPRQSDLDTIIRSAYEWSKNQK